MSPEQRIEQLERRVEELERVTNLQFAEQMLRYIQKGLVIQLANLPDIKLSDLSDVSNTDGASTNEVLKKTATTWQPGTDNT